ncbi:MAG: alpha/beta hydrolase [Gemmatimonadota bacterium]|nr:alpha/beta hydrolase [Gemmatimonadota bacterium]
MVVRWLAVLAALYLVYAGLFFAIQRWVLYPGTRLGPGPSWPGGARTPAAETIALPSAAGDIRAWYAPAPAGAATGTGALVFHGNAELAVDLLAPFRPLADLGVSALFVEYPGFGGEPGRPTEISIMEVAAAAHDWLAAREEVDGDRIVAIGRSLGSGPAAGLSRRKPVRALVLWSPFVSVGYLALRKYGLPPFLALDRFDTRGALESFEGPVLIFHGTRDRVIPFRNATVLAEAHPEATLVRWSCGHNDCPPTWDELWEPLADFLAKSGLLPREAGDAPSSSAGATP